MGLQTTLLTNVSRLGRPSSYKPEYAEQAFKLRLSGKTIEQVADSLDISQAAFYEWCKKHPELPEALKRGSEQAVSQVVNALFQRATGYETVEQQAIKVKVGQHQEKVELVEVKKKYPPDPTSMIFFLKNRDSMNWRDRTEVSATVGIMQIVAEAVKIGKEPVTVDDEPIEIGNAQGEPGDDLV